MTVLSNQHKDINISPYRSDVELHSTALSVVPGSTSSSDGFSTLQPSGSVFILCKINWEPTVGSLCSHLDRNALVFRK